MSPYQTFQFTLIALTRAAWMGSLAALLLTSGVANATLDKNESSVTSDVTQLKAAKRQQLSVSSKSTLHMHELTSDANTVREYADADGHIYAVTWRGAAQPNLSVLLGDHYPSYVKQTKVRALTRGGRGPRRSQTTSGAVVQTTGHMGSLRGLAYIPSQVPSGINVDDLQ